MSDMGWLAVVLVILLVFIAGVFVLLWRNGEGNNGLKGEFEERLTNVENEVVRLWDELKRQANRWIP